MAIRVLILRIRDFNTYSAIRHPVPNGPPREVGSRFEITAHKLIVFVTKRNS